MSHSAIKICGLNTADSLETAIRARADYVGFNFFPPSPRYITPRDAAVLGERAQGRIMRVGVFVDSTDEELGEAVIAAQLDAIQLHGGETPMRAAQLKARFSLPVWKVISVAGPNDIVRANAYSGAADFILFDAKTPAGTLPGGMGLAFDWPLVLQWKGPLSWGLAGGLTPDNVAEAVRLTGAPLVDTASGVESAPGVKDNAKIVAFCSAVRSAQFS